MRGFCGVAECRELSWGFAPPNVALSRALQRVACSSGLCAAAIHCLPAAFSSSEITAGDARFWLLA